MHFCPIKLRSFFTQVIKNTKTLYLYISCMQFEIYIPVQRLSIFDFLGEKLSELNRTKLHEKVFSEGEKFPAEKFNGTKNICGEILGDKKFKFRNCTLWKYHAPNVMRVICHALEFPTVKFPSVKFNEGKMSCDGISGCKISCAKFPAAKLSRRKFPRQKCHETKFLVA